MHNVRNNQVMTKCPTQAAYTACHFLAIQKLLPIETIPKPLDAAQQGGKNHLKVSWFSGGFCQFSGSSGKVFCSIQVGK